jgi:imidazolonepropionase-like amidohydrolase
LPGSATADALIGSSSLNAQALGTRDHIGSLGPDMNADVIAVDDDPLKTSPRCNASSSWMNDGRVYENAR